MGMVPWDIMLRRKLTDGRKTKTIITKGKWKYTEFCKTFLTHNMPSAAWAAEKYMTNADCLGCKCAWDGIFCVCVSWGRGVEQKQRTQVTVSPKTCLYINQRQQIMCRFSYLSNCSLFWQSPNYRAPSVCVSECQFNRVRACAWVCIVYLCVADERKQDSFDCNYLPTLITAPSPSPLFLLEHTLTHTAYAHTGTRRLNTYTLTQACDMYTQQIRASPNFPFSAALSTNRLFLPMQI